MNDCIQQELSLLHNYSCRHWLKSKTTTITSWLNGVEVHWLHWLPCTFSYRSVPRSLALSRAVVACDLVRQSETICHQHPNEDVQKKTRRRRRRRELLLASAAPDQNSPLTSTTYLLQWTSQLTLNKQNIIRRTLQKPTSVYIHTQQNGCTTPCKYRKDLLTESLRD